MKDVTLNTEEERKYKKIQHLCGNAIDEYIERSLAEKPNEFLIKIKAHRELHIGKRLELDEIFKEYDIFYTLGKEHLLGFFKEANVNSYSSQEAHNAYLVCMKDFAFKFSDCVLNDGQESRFEHLTKLKAVVSKIYNDFQKIRIIGSYSMEK